MRPETILSVLRKRQEAMQVEIFSKPPQDFNEFTQRQGIWIGLNYALSDIEDARKKEKDDD